MDALDREILSRLQEDGRLSITDLASDVGLSLSTCHRRLKELERSGAIEGYRAILSPEALGLGFEAIVFVTLAMSNREAVAAFEEAVAAIPNVVSAERLFGEPDYILHVLARDLDDYQELYDGTLGRLPGVTRLTSTLVMKRVRSPRTVPVDVKGR